MDMLKEDIQKEMGEECDTLFDELVTDKPKVFPSYGGYYNGRHHGVTTTSVGKNLATLTETSQKTTVINQHTGTTHSTGATTGMTSNAGAYYNFYANCEYTDPEGACELFMLGYTEPEILYMEKCMFIYDDEDLGKYELEYGKAQVQLDEDLHNIKPTITTTTSA
jgi:hypothetical protein